MKTIKLKDGMGIQAIADRFIADLQAELSARWEAWRIDLSRKELHEVVGALLARQVTLATEFACVPACWNYHVGPLFLRAMADVYISLAWILEEPTQSQERAQKYIYFGLGQEKLQLEHRRAEIKNDSSEPTEGEREALEASESWINSQQYTFLTEVNVANWSGITIRKMAEEAHCLDFYNYVYQPWSGVAHSMWQHIGRYNVEQCGNPLHLHHLVPALPKFDADLHLLYLAGKYAEKAFQLFDSKIGVHVAVNSAFIQLDEGLEQLARECDPAEPTAS